jgi:hypothetical protein
MVCVTGEWSVIKLKEPLWLRSERWGNDPAPGAESDCRMNAAESAPALEPASLRRTRLIGGLSVWSMIALSPLGIAFLSVLSFPIFPLLSIFFPGRADRIWEGLAETYDGLLTGLWDPLFGSLGYAYRGTGFQCMSNTDMTVGLLILALWGTGIGTVGALFDVKAMRQSHGRVYAENRLRLILLWSAVFILMNVGSVMLGLYDTQGLDTIASCQRTLLVDIAFQTGNLFVYIIPIPILLVISSRISRQIWETNRVQAQSDISIVPPNG